MFCLQLYFKNLNKNTFLTSLEDTKLIRIKATVIFPKLFQNIIGPIQVSGVVVVLEKAC